MIWFYDNGKLWKTLLFAVAQASGQTKSFPVLCGRHPVEGGKRRGEFAGVLVAEGRGNLDDPQAAVFQQLRPGLHPIFPHIAADGLAVDAPETGFQGGQRDPEPGCQLRKRDTLLRMADQPVPDFPDGPDLVPGKIRLRCGRNRAAGAQKL